MATSALPCKLNDIPCLAQMRREGKSMTMGVDGWVSLAGDGVVGQRKLSLGLTEVSAEIDSTP